MTIIEMLNRLAEKAPDVCKKIAYSDGPSFAIGDYVFWYNSLNKFMASYNSIIAVRGRPALAWLADAIMAECERLKLSFESEFWFYNNTPRWRIYSIFLKKNFVSTENYTEALLAAFLAVMEGER